MNKKQKILFVVATVFGGFFAFSHPAYAAYEVGISSSGLVDLGEIMPAPTSGALSNTASDTVTVSTNCPAGYSVYATGVNGGSTSLVDSDHGSTIVTSSNTIASPGTLANNTWGLVADQTSAASGNFSGLSAYTASLSSISPIHTAGSTDASVRNDNIPVYYGVKVDTNTKPGNYSTDVLYTVLMNEACSKYTLNFNGNSATTNNLASKTLVFGDAIDLSEISAASKISRTGYSLAGWKDQDGNSYGTSGTANVNPNSVETVTLTAQWTVNSHSVSISKSSRISSTSGAGTYDYGSRVDISASGLDTGYHFTNWTTSSSGVSFNSSSSSSTYFTMPDDDVSITANAAANTYTIKYEAGSTGGSCSGSTSAIYNSNVTLASSGCSKSGYYYLSGWSTSSSGGSKTYNLGQTLTTPNFTSTNGGTYTLYPYFEYDPPTTYTLSVSNGIIGTSGSTTSGSYTAGSTVTLTARSPGSYYSFSSWSSSNGGSFSSRYSTSTTFTMPSNSVTVTANYSYNPPAPSVQNCSSSVHPTATTGCKMADGRTWILGNSGNSITWDNMFTGATGSNNHDATVNSGICPSGYSAPKITDYDTLIQAYGGTANSYDRNGYQETTGALYSVLGLSGRRYYWSSTENSSDYAYSLNVNSSDSFSLYYSVKARDHYVLCYK